MIAAASIDVPGVFVAQGNGALTAIADIRGTGSIAFGQNGSLTSGQDISLAGKLLSNGLQVTAANSVTLMSVQAGGAFSVVANGNAGDGDVTFNGSAAVVGATSVQATRDVIVNGTLAGGARVGVTAQRNVTIANSGTVQSVGDLAGINDGRVPSNGTISSGGKLAASAARRYRAERRDDRERRHIADRGARPSQHRHPCRSGCGVADCGTRRLARRDERFHQRRYGRRIA